MRPPSLASLIPLLLVISGASGCGNPIIGSCKSAINRTCTDVYSQSGDVIVSDSEAQCASDPTTTATGTVPGPGGVWSNDPCSTSKSLGGCATRSVSSFGLNEFGPVTWYFFGARVGRRLAITKANVQEFCGEDYRAP